MSLNSWKKAIPLIRSGYSDELLDRIRESRKKTIIYPEQNRIFHALKMLPFEKVSVVIIGQDPYHGKGQAHGLAFSVPEGIKPPPSLNNIFKEIIRDVYSGNDRQFSADLRRWATQGVLLLNSTLTVEEGKPGSHKHLGWTDLTDQIISELSCHRNHLAFLLWGAHAASKKTLIDPEKHLVLEAPHPSPLSAYRGFMGCGHFSRVNTFLKRHNTPEILW